MSTRLAQDFFAADTITVARHLLGQRLVHRLPDGTRLSGRIVETEAYLGQEDPAAHSFGGRRTPRTEVMFAGPGTSYIYFIYGMYFCFNVVTMPRGTPEAVLIRALDPQEGIGHMQAQGIQRAASRKGRARIAKVQPPYLLTNGPGKLCTALELGRPHNALDLTTSSVVWLEADGAASDFEIVEGPRVGIGHRHDAVHWPLRYGIKDHPALSPVKFVNSPE